MTQHITSHFIYISNSIISNLIVFMVNIFYYLITYQIRIYFDATHAEIILYALIYTSTNFYAFITKWTILLILEV